MPLPKEERITYAEYCQLPDDGRRYEVIEGELFVTPSPVFRHQRISHWITRLVAAWAEDHGLGAFVAAPFDTILAESTIVQPDHVFIRKERLGTVIKKWAHGAPDLVIEILSPATASRDHVTKRQAYAKHRIPEYWLIDPDACTVTVLTLQGEHYDKIGCAVGDVPIPSKVLAGLPVLACDLFRE
ncbi:MAG: Uma2 family endonuclease [Candidatus Wallbacteria bacterium]|nr:Uma2 family endonuclease [Candidatus Wallbacteria bacterium]